MSSIGSWVAMREPRAPAPLSRALSTLLEGSRRTSEDQGPDEHERGLTEELAARARERLERALARPGHERDSAYRLLEADALLTYACEAAVDEVDRESSLRRILTVASRPR